MKPSFSLALIVCLAGWTPTAAAQEPGRGDAIARSVAREAARFAAAQQDQSADPDWSRVRNLAPGAEVVLTVKGSRPDRWYFVQADESELTVRKASDPGQVVEKIPRADVDQIVQMRSVRNHGSARRVALWTAGGFFAGSLAVTLVILPLSGGTGGEPNYCGRPGYGRCWGDVLIPAGGAVGALWGAVHAYRTSHYLAVIYRAP